MPVRRFYHHVKVFFKFTVQIFLADAELRRLILQTELTDFNPRFLCRFYDFLN